MVQTTGRDSSLISSGTELHRLKVKETFSVKQSFCWQTGVYFVEIITVTLSGRCSIFFFNFFFQSFCCQTGGPVVRKPINANNLTTVSASLIQKSLHSKFQEAV